ncbi:MAG: helix-turn-helix transcriptional regulator [Clostridia bacterium]|nr:helix-turn-helix transcriptional regulator [Clostridia bacterium]
MHKISREIEIEGFNSIYYFEFGKDFSHPPERHDFWELVYVDSGEINAVTGGIGRRLTQGEVIFHRPMELHAHVSNKIVPNSMIVISFTTHSPDMEFFHKKVFTLDKTAKTLLRLFMEEARRALGELPSEYTNKNPLDFSDAEYGSFQLLECYLTELLLILHRQDTGIAKVFDGVHSRELAESSIIELITAYLAENLYTPLTLSDVCSKFFIGKSQLCKLFADHLGEGPIEYFLKLKTAEAKRLLGSEKYSVTKISDMLGYSSIHNFSRAFKKSVGISPTEYKKKLNR